MTDLLHLVEFEARFGESTRPVLINPKFIESVDPTDDNEGEGSRIYLASGNYHHVALDPREVYDHIRGSQAEAPGFRADVAAALGDDWEDEGCDPEDYGELSQPLVLVKDADEPVVVKATLVCSQPVKPVAKAWNRDNLVAMKEREDCCLELFEDGEGSCMRVWIRGGESLELTAFVHFNEAGECTGIEIEE